MRDVARFSLKAKGKDWIVHISTADGINPPAGTLITHLHIAEDAINTWDQTLSSSLDLRRIDLVKRDLIGSWHVIIEQLNTQERI